MSVWFKDRFLFPVIAILLGCGMALLLLEIVLRVASLAPPRGLHSVNESNYKAIPGIWNPGQDFIWKELPPLPYHVSINALGYRGTELQRDKKADELRVFVVGDSYTFGSFVDNEETLPAQLESRLADKCTAKDVSVINSGVPGSTIRTQVNMIERGLVLKPDLVALVFHDNDIENLADPLWDRIVVNRASKSKFPVSVIWPLIRNTATWNFYLRIREIVRSKDILALNVDSKNQQLNEDESKIDPAMTKKLKALYMKDLYDLADRLSEQNLEFVFVVYPGHHYVRGELFDDLPDWAEKTGVAGNIPTLNLGNALRQGLGDDVEAGFSLPYDGHPSKLGYQLAGEAMADYLLQQTGIKAFCL